MWHLVPQPETEPRPSTLGTWSLSHWTTREIPEGNILPPLVPRVNSSWNVIPDSSNVVSWRAILVCLFVCLFLAQKIMQCVRHAWFVPKNSAGFNNLYGDKHRGKWLLSFSVSFVVQVRSSIWNLRCFRGFAGGSLIKNLPAMQEARVWPLVGKIPGRREWLPTPVFLPGDFHGQRSLVGYSPWGHMLQDVARKRKKQEELSSLRMLNSQPLASSW